MFYVCIVPALIMSMYMIVYLRNLRKHDNVLYRFCQIRRKAMSILRNDGFGMQGQDYVSLRVLVENLNITINNYKECKTVLFNFRRFNKYLTEYKISAQEVEQFKLPNDERIKALVRDFSIALFRAFLEYTPLIRSEIAIRIILFIATALTKIGINHANNFAKQISDTFSFINDQSNKFKNSPRYSQA